MNESILDKVVLDSTSECLSSLSRMTYLLMSMLITLFYVILSGTDDVDLVIIKIKAQYLPLIIFPVLYCILLHACRCLSIVHQFLDPLSRIEPTVKQIGQTSTTYPFDEIRLLVMTHEWPCNPFVDFLRASGSANYGWNGWFRIVISISPFILTFVLTATYIALLVNNINPIYKIMIIVTVTTFMAWIFQDYNTLTSAIIRSLHPEDHAKRAEIYDAVGNLSKVLAAMFTLFIIAYITSKIHLTKSEANVTIGVAALALGPAMICATSAYLRNGLMAMLYAVGCVIVLVVGVAGVLSGQPWSLAQDSHRVPLGSCTSGWWCA